MLTVYAVLSVIFLAEIYVLLIGRIFEVSKPKLVFINLVFPLICVLALAVVIDLVWVQVLVAVAAQLTISTGFLYLDLKEEKRWQLSEATTDRYRKDNSS